MPTRLSDNLASLIGKADPDTHISQHYFWPTSKPGRRFTTEHLGANIQPEKLILAPRYPKNDYGT